jgi:hypothetical protein
MEFMQFYSDLETVFDQYGLLKTIFNSDRFRPMVPQLVSQDMTFMLKPPLAYKSQMLDLPMPQTPITKIKEPQPLYSAPSGHVEVSAILGGENLEDRLQAAMSPTGLRIPERSSSRTSLSSPTSKFGDGEVRGGAIFDETANIRISEWTVDVSSELFHHVTISREEALFTKVTRLHEKAIKFVWRVIMYGIQNCPKAERVACSIRQPDIYTLRNFLIAVFQEVSLDPIKHQLARFTIMTFKDYQVTTPEDFYTQMSKKAMEIALHTNDPTTRKDDVCISAFQFGIRTWNASMRDMLDKLTEPNKSFTEVTSKFFAKLASNSFIT